MGSFKNVILFHFIAFYETKHIKGRGIQRRYLHCDAALWFTMNPWQWLCFCHITGTVPTSLLRALHRCVLDYNSSTLPPSGTQQPWPRFGRRLTAPDACSQCSTRGRRCRCRCHCGAQRDEQTSNNHTAWLHSQFLMSRHGINDLFISPTWANLRVICCPKEAKKKINTACGYSLHHILLSIHDNLLSLATETNKCQ